MIRRLIARLGPGSASPLHDDEEVEATANETDEELTLELRNPARGILLPGRHRADRGRRQSLRRSIPAG